VGGEDESFRAVSTGDRSYTSQWRTLEILFSQGEAETERSTVEDAQVELQASEQEIAQALKDKHIPTIDGESPLNRLLAMSYTKLTSRCTVPTRMPMPIRRPAPALPDIPPQDPRDPPDVPRPTLPASRRSRRPRTVPIP
jgi:hypothetical protein